jgi:hypothetical protein
MTVPTNHKLSLPGLTGQSNERPGPAQAMDAPVKPAHDNL